MRASAIDTLRVLNQRLRSLLTQFEPERLPSTTPSYQQIAEFFDELLRAPAALRLISDCGSMDAEMSEEVSQCRGYIVRLEQLLPSIQTVLLAERIRVEGERKHLASAAAWARASKDSL